jgi:hypothetical protein
MLNLYFECAYHGKMYLKKKKEKLPQGYSYFEEIGTGSPIAANANAAHLT